MAPTRIFIVPYRNRSHHKVFFCKYMKFLLEDMDNYEVYFSHQCDTRSFNRGAVKNIGFLAMKEKYPDDYKNITFIFNDIDTMPYHKLFEYTATPGVVKHYYGFKYALGGIVAITGGDFEKINGFPNFWGWGMEDNVLQKRCENHRIVIDRTNFFQIGAFEMLQLFDGVSRIISKKDPWRAENDNGLDGLKTIHALKYAVGDESSNPQDNVFKEEGFPIFYINISTFMTGVRFETDNYVDYDLRDPPRKILHPSRIITSNNVPLKDDWTNIPYRPDFAEKNVDKLVQKEEIKLNIKAPVSNNAKIREARVNNSGPHVNNGNKATKSANIGLGGVKAGSFSFVK